MSAVRLLLLLATAGVCAEGIRIAGRDYRQEQLQAARGARCRIVSAGDAVLYVEYGNNTVYALKEGVETTVEGLPDGRVFDLLLDSYDVVWVATIRGLYQYSISKRKATIFSDRRLYRLGADANGTVYAVDYKTEALYMRSGKSLHLVSEKRSWTFAFTREGHFFSVGLTNSTLYRATGGPAGPSMPIAGYEGEAWLLEVDRRDDVLYICSDSGLYTVLPGRDAAERMEGVGWSVYGLGFSPNGDIYIGSGTEITTMSLVTPITVKLDTVFTKLDRKLKTMKEEFADQVEKNSMHVKLSQENDRKLSDFMSQMSAAVEGLEKMMQTLRGECSQPKEETEAMLDILEPALLLTDSTPASAPELPS